MAAGRHRCRWRSTPIRRANPAWPGWPASSRIGTSACCCCRAPAARSWSPGMTARVRDWIMRNAPSGGRHQHDRIGAETGRLVAEKKSDATVAIADLDERARRAWSTASAADARIGGRRQRIAGAGARAERSGRACIRVQGRRHRACGARGRQRPTRSTAPAWWARLTARRGDTAPEEVYVALAPGPRDQPPPDPAGRNGGARSALRGAASRSAYKGTWVRMVRTLGRDAMLAARPRQCDEPIRDGNCGTAAARTGSSVSPHS